MTRTESVALDLQGNRHDWRHEEIKPWTPREIFAKHGRPRELTRHRNIYVMDEPADQVFWVCWGEVSLIRNVVDGHEFTVDHSGQGSVFGEQEVLLDTPRQATASCRTDVALLCLPRETSLALREQVPEFAWWLNRTLATRLLRMQGRVETLLFKSAQGKVAQALIDLVRDHGRVTGEGTLIDYAITHLEIGSQIGCARETVSYAFIEFRKMGLIATCGRRTIVRDMNRLRRIADQ